MFKMDKLVWSLKTLQQNVLCMNPQEQLQGSKFTDTTSLTELLQANKNYIWALSKIIFF